LKNKAKWVIVSTILLASFLVPFILQLSKYTTFREAVSEMLSGETIHKIMISDSDKEKVFDLNQ